MFFATLRNNLAAFALVVAALVITFAGEGYYPRVVSAVLIAYSALLVIMGNQTLMAVRYTEKIQVCFTERVTQYGVRCLYDPRYEDVIPDTTSEFLFIVVMAIFPVLDFCSTMLNKLFRTRRFGQLRNIEILDVPIRYPHSEVISRD